MLGKSQVNLYRDQQTKTIGTSAGQLAGSNPRRWAFWVSVNGATNETPVASTVIASLADTSTTGVKLSYTVPTGKVAIINSASKVNRTGTGIIAQLEIIVGGTTIRVFPVTNSDVYTGNITLKAGDSIQWNVTTAIAGSTNDFSISVSEYNLETRVSLSFSGTAVLDQGITVYSGSDPLLIMYDHIGQGFREDISAISNVAGVSVSIIDVFEVDCPCTEREGYPIR